MGLPGRELEMERMAAAIAENVDFRRESPAGAA
jgi:hypothetical protein